MMTSHLRDAVRMTQLMHGKCWSQRLAHRWCLQTMTLRTSLVVQWLRICLLMQGMQVQSLVQELRSHIWRVSETQAPKLQNSVHCNYRALVLQQEKPSCCHQRSPCTPQLERERTCSCNKDPTQPQPKVTLHDTGTQLTCSQFASLRSMSHDI